MNTESSALTGWPRLALGLGACVLVCALSAQAVAQEIPKLPPPGLDSPPADLPHVRIISLGGTISGTATERLNITNYGAPRLAPEDWIKALPELALVAKVTPEDLREPEGKTSAPISLHWMKVARAPPGAREPMTASTASSSLTARTCMAETAYFMNLVVSIRKPVVFVGAQRPWTGISGDGPLNCTTPCGWPRAKDAGGQGRAAGDESERPRRPRCRPKRVHIALTRSRASISVCWASRIRTL